MAYLATAERRVARARRRGDTSREKRALAQVEEARIALGEVAGEAPGPATGPSLATRIKCTTLSLLRHRAPDKSICPSEVARLVAPPEQWRSIMPATRAVAVALAAENILRLTRGERVLDPNDLGKGPIRLRRGDLFR